MIRVAPPPTRRKARIEIIPLIDIIFFLLATFVLVSMSMVKNQGVPIRLPVAQTGKMLGRAEVLTLRISREGAVFIGKQEHSLETLETALKDYQASQADPRVVIQGDTEAAYGKVVAVLDLARKMGVTKVAVQTTNKLS